MPKNNTNVYFIKWNSGNGSKSLKWSVMFFFTINYPCPEISLLHHQIISFSSFEPDNQFTACWQRRFWLIATHCGSCIHAARECNGPTVGKSWAQSGLSTGRVHLKVAHHHLKALPHLNNKAAESAQRIFIRVSALRDRYFVAHAGKIGRCVYISPNIIFLS